MVTEHRVHITLKSMTPTAFKDVLESLPPDVRITVDFDGCLGDPGEYYHIIETYFDGDVRMVNVPLSFPF